MFWNRKKNKLEVTTPVDVYSPFGHPVRKIGYIIHGHSVRKPSLTLGVILRLEGTGRLSINPDDWGWFTEYMKGSNHWVNNGLPIKDVACLDVKDGDYSSAGSAPSYEVTVEINYDPEDESVKRYLHGVREAHYEGMKSREREEDWEKTIRELYESGKM